MSECQYKKYLFKLQKAILLNEPEDMLYKFLKYVNFYGNKIFSLEEFIYNTKSRYILSKTEKKIKPIDGIYAKCIEIYGEYTEKKYQKLYRDIHKDKLQKAPYHIKTQKERIKIEKVPYHIKIEKVRIKTQKERMFLKNIYETNIHGICFACGELTFFTESHHIFGRKTNDFTLSICISCHYKYRGKNHYISIGKKVEA